MRLVVDQFTLKDRRIVVVGSEGLLGTVARKTISELGGQPISVDVKDMGIELTDYAALRYVADQGQVHGVINCAIGNQMPTDDAQRFLESDLKTGLTGAAVCHKVFHAPLKATKGVFINVGSDLSHKAPDPERYGNQFKPLAYSVVKHSIIGMTRYYAALWGKDGIRVNCFCPGSIDQGQAIPDCPLNRLAQASEMAGPLAFLLSDASSYMTGAVLSVDGGSTCW
jgi:NAD(P)-dependent dehydrogenase (short-subunit alcohol dehydrogenase family)